MILDLYLLLLNPFQSIGSRPTKLVLSAFTVSLFFALLCTYETSVQSDFADYLFTCVIVFNLVFAPLVMTLVLYRLFKESTGTSTEVREQISKRYLEFVASFVFLSYPINLIQRPSYSYNQTSGNFTASTVAVKGWAVSICSFGVIMALSRLRDPLIKTRLVEIWMTWTCRGERVRGQVDKESKKSNLNTNLQSSINTDLVISILKGITILAATSSDNVDNITDSDMLQVKQTVTIEIKKFKIKNAKEFDVAEKQKQEEEEQERKEEEQKNMRASFSALKLGKADVDDYQNFRSSNASEEMFGSIAGEEDAKFDSAP